MPEPDYFIPGPSGSLSGLRVFTYPPEAKIIARLQDGIDAIGLALSEHANLVILPVDRLDPAFFQLRTGLAGEILQKFVVYHLRVVIFGDISSFAAQSKPLRDFMRECNRGSAIWFLSTPADLQQYLRA